MSDAELTKKLEEYLKEYGHGYDSKASAFIRDNFLRYYHDFEHIDILSQIYSHISALSDDRDVYKKFMNFINEKYGLNQDILEVGSFFSNTSRKNRYISAKHKQRKYNSNRSTFDSNKIRKRKVVQIIIF